jgi:subtilisin family serine protease
MNKKLALICGLLFLVPVFVFILLGAGGRQSDAASGKRPVFSIPLTDKGYKEGELLIRLNPGMDAPDAGALSAVPGATIEDVGGGVSLVKLPEGMSTAEGLSLYGANSNFYEISPNYTRKALQTYPDDHLFWVNQWNLHNTGQTGGTPDADIDAPEAWDTVTGSGFPTSTEEVVVVVLDTGVDYAHPDLAPNMWVNINELRNNGTVDLIYRLTNGIDDDGDLVIDDFDGETVADWSLGPRVDNLQLPILDFNGVDDDEDGVEDDFDGVVLNGEDDDNNVYIDDIFGINSIIEDPENDPLAGDPMDDHYHGTHVAGIIGAAGDNFGYGIAGVNWHVKIMACKFLNASGSGTVLDEFACLSYISTMANRGVPIVAINASYGGYFPSFSFEEAWINALRMNGILFIAAAGNGVPPDFLSGVDNDGLFAYPASYSSPNIISVTATDHRDVVPSFANFGNQNVHLGAPGVNIMSTFPGGLFGDYVVGSSGTSMAAPHVTGAVAWLYPAFEVVDGFPPFPIFDWPFLRNRILAGGDLKPSLDLRTVTGRRLNLNGAINCSDREILARLKPATSEYFAWLDLSGTFLFYTILEGRNEITAVFGRDSHGTLFSNPVTFSALHIDCDGSTGDEVTVTVGGAATLLYDDGSGPDAEFADGVFAGQWMPPLSERDVTATFPNRGTSSSNPSFNDTFTIRVRETSVVNGDFAADAGRNATLEPGEFAELDGSRSGGLNDGFQPLYYFWECLNACGIAFLDPTSPFPIVTAPAYIQPVPGEDDPNEYIIRLTVTKPDEFGLPFGPSDTDEITLTVAPTGSGGGGSPCFIATAAYGSGDVRHLSTLRNFRDRYLLTNAPGRLFVRTYYHVSPPVASVIAQHSTLKTAVRLILLPFVGFAKFFLITSLVQKIAALAAFAAALGFVMVRYRSRAAAI